ncbi:GNAT family N-acetyltransferase [Chryseobacterium indologenes]|uniref:N-acetyltransferase domain-containing protein n=1 Tax=Chryseobacterium indologenes TaxID=253 RepID=A0A0N0ZX87_CHRID|nr:GNAT family N-acetyltransferase [Chryseobacterium indologenes]KPE52357.1 hypothetical protein AOB46_05670 [Chryseobacterium indologenes]
MEKPINPIITNRLLLIPYTIKICNNILNNDFEDLYEAGLKKGIGWPDHDVLETLPKIINNLSSVENPTGFESWMIIKNDTKEIIGDAGFKGFNFTDSSVDIGYGIIEGERKKGYAEEASKALIEWAFSTGMVKEITARCATDNLGSIHLLKKLGFSQVNKDDEMIYWSSAYSQ